MAGQGAGPSRRSHTKSRKGCKTCKRRHIRCDETFPQCRNCTKHQVRCDYMENMGSDMQSQSGSPEQSSLVFTPESERRVDLWQQTGSFPYSDLNVFPLPSTQEYSKTDLQLIHHLSSISNDLLLNNSNELTLWTHKLPKFLSIASSYPYVMNALLSFSANHLAWTQSSPETRNLQIHHGSIALRGLHEAIGSFSPANADAILAASLLMLWQATDWRSWSSLRAGVQSVLSTMQSWSHESLFKELIAEEDLVAESFRAHRRRASISASDRAAIMQSIIQSLQRLQYSLVGLDMEAYWVEQLLSYIQRLQSTPPAQTPEEQFSQIYLLRKWLFWVPISLLQRQGGKGPAMLTLAHFYATALTLEPVFPDLGPAFCSALALPALDSIVNVTTAMRSEQGLDSASSEIATLMQFPHQAAFNYRSRLTQPDPTVAMQPSQVAYSFNPEMLNYTTTGNLSPAFAPSTPHYTPSVSTSASSSSTPFLEVPSSQASQTGFSYGTSSWGAMPSPGFPPEAYTSDIYDMSGLSLGSSSGAHDFRGGFVSPLPVWT